MKGKYNNHYFYQLNQDRTPQGEEVWDIEVVTQLYCDNDNEPLFRPVLVCQISKKSTALKLQSELNKARGSHYELMLREMADMNHKTA